MRRHHFFATIFAALLSVLLADTASAYYHPGMGRFMQRDPNGTAIAPPARVGSTPAPGDRFAPRDPHVTTSWTHLQRGLFTHNVQNNLQPGADQGILPTGLANQQSGFWQAQSKPALQYADGMNLYGYVHSNPITHVDPTGLQCACGEKANQVAAVGPFDAWTARNLANDALQVARNTGLPGAHNGEQDAFRHCYWSCRMAQEIGPGQAKEVGDIHEECGGNPPGEQAMDLHNNSVGRGLGQLGANCRQSCLNALGNGNLQVGPGGNPGGPPYGTY